MKIEQTFQNNNKNLFIIATPIGNINEINKRAIEQIKKTQYLLVESLSKTLKLFKLLEISHKNKHIQLVKKANENNQFKINIKENYCLLSDAGYPLISDPGYKLVKKFELLNFNIVVINGSTSVIHSLILSGAPINKFNFYGFLSKKNKALNDEIKSIYNSNITTIAFITSSQILKIISIVDKISKTWTISICKELTKINETKYVFNSSNFDISKINLKGEFTIVFYPSNQQDKTTESDLLRKINFYLKKGISKKIISELVSEEYNVRKNYIYKLIINNN